MVCVALIRNADGAPSGVVVNMTHLSRQKELEAQPISGDHQEVPQAFLHKPYQMAELRDALQKML